MTNVKGFARSDKPTENYHTKVSMALSSTERCIVFTQFFIPSHCCHQCHFQVQQRAVFRKTIEYNKILSAQDSMAEEASHL